MIVALADVALAASVDDWPTHIADGVAVGATDGFSLTVTVIAPVAEQLSELVTVILYVVEAAGETSPFSLLPAIPALHAYDCMVPLTASALAASVAVSPSQIVDGVAVGLTVGVAPTFTVTVPVAVQLLVLVTVTT